MLTCRTHKGYEAKAKCSEAKEKGYELNSQQSEGFPTMSRIPRKVESGNSTEGEIAGKCEHVLRHISDNSQLKYSFTEAKFQVRGGHSTRLWLEMKMILSEIPAVRADTKGSFFQRRNCLKREHFAKNA